MLWTKRAYQSTILQTFECSNKILSYSSCHFETTRSAFIQILHHWLVQWKITSLYFCSLNLLYFGQKEPMERKFSHFWVVGWKFTIFLMWYLKLQVTFSLINFALLCSVKLFCTSLAETFYDLDKRNPSKCKITDFRLLTFFDYRLLLLKVHKISAKKGIEELCLVTLKSDAKFK